MCFTVKPGPVRDFNCTRTDNTSVIILSWKFPAQLGPAYINLSYRVNVKAENDWDSRIVVRDNIFPPKFKTKHINKKSYT